jgi:O-antigen/teichoic acid export membrane protein
VATERVIYRTLLDSAMRLLTVIMFGLVIVADLKMKGLFQAAALVYCSGFIMSCVLINRKGFLMEWKIDKASILYLIKESHMLMISQFIVQGYTQVNIIVLKMFSMVEQISFYQIPQRIIEPFRLLPRSLMMAYLPSLSILGNDKNNRIALVKVYTSLLKNITTCGLLICICAVMFAKTIVFLFFGKEFMGAVIPLQISIWAIIPFSINTVQMSLLTASRNQNILYVGNGCCLIVSAIMGIILIPRYGAIGASMAIIISSITLVLVNAYFLRDRIGRASIEWPAVFRLLFSSLALWTVIWSLKSYIPDLALFPIGIIVYGSILFWLKFFTTDEIDVISGMVKSLLFRTGLVHRK